MSIKSNKTSAKRIFRLFNWFKFPGVNRISAVSLENTTDRTVHTKYYLSTVEIKDCNVMIDGQNFFHQPVQSNLRTYDNIWKTATGQRDDGTTSCLLDCNYFSKYYKMITMNHKQQAPDASSKEI